MGIVIRIWIFFLPLFLTHVYAQEEEVLWRPELHLEWSDFKGEPRSSSRIAAVTASGISYTFNALEKDGYYEVDYTVNAYFYPNQSWYRPEMCDEVILSHENLHFDITELFARKMRRIMADTQFTDNVRAEIKTIYQQIIKELSAFQDRYDKETNFSRDRAAQMVWNKEIAAALSN